LGVKETLVSSTLSVEMMTLVAAAELGRVALSA
jgi:hypothetical protein